MSGLGPRLRAAARRWPYFLGLAVLGCAGTAISWIAYTEGLDLRPVPQADKMVHFSFAGLLVFCLDGALGRPNAWHVGRARTPIPLAVVLVLAPRAVEEAAQVMALWRTASIFDWLADVLGALVFAWVARRLAARQAPSASGAPASADGPANASPKD